MKFTYFVKQVTFGYVISGITSSYSLVLPNFHIFCSETAIDCPKICNMKNNNTCCFLLFLLLSLVFGELKALAGNTKLYVATNKEIYSFSESVQFQIFLLNAPNSNKTVYAELLDCKGNKLAKKMLPLTSGISWGNLNIPETGEAAFYIFYCYVISKDSVEVDCSKKIYINNNFKTENIESGRESNINFFNEGGTFVAMMPNKLLISFKDEFGKPLVGTGKITDSKKFGITNFVIDESGYATISFKPDFDVNYAIVIKNKAGRETKKDLPPASPNGVNLTVTVNKDSLTYTAYSLTGDNDQLDYKLDIISDGKTVYKSDINFIISFSVIQETICLKNLAEGFLTFRLTDKKNKLSALRVIYNPGENRDSILLKIIDSVSKKSATVKIPGYANGFSFINILEKDNEVDPVNKYFKDQVEEPVVFNNPENEISLNDLLIRMDKQPAPRVTEPENNNPFLTLKGVAYNSEGKTIKNKKLNLIFLSKNLKKEYKVITTDRNGNFEIGSLIFYDTVKVYYQLADNSDEKNNIQVDLKIVPAGYFTGNASKYIRFACADNTNKTAAAGTKNNNNIAVPDTILQTGKTLKEVTVKGTKEKVNSNTQKFIDENVSAQNNQSNFLRNEFDFIANPQVIDNRPLFEFLRGRINLDINISARGNVKISTIAGDGIGVYLDDMEVTGDLDMVTSLQIKDIALVRYYSLPLKPRVQSTNTKYSAFFGNSGGGGDLMIYTRKGFTPMEQMVKGLPKTSIIGYDQDNPVNDESHATTARSLYWKPNWVPQKEETIYIGLPAIGSEKKVQLIIEGINLSRSMYTFTEDLVFN